MPLYFQAYATTESLNENFKNWALKISNLENFVKFIQVFSLKISPHISTTTAVVSCFKLSPARENDCFVNHI